MRIVSVLCIWCFFNADSGPWLPVQYPSIFLRIFVKKCIQWLRSGLKHFGDVLRFFDWVSVESFCGPESNKLGIEIVKVKHQSWLIWLRWISDLFLMRFCMYDITSDRKLWLALKNLPQNLTFNLDGSLDKRVLVTALRAKVRVQIWNKL